MMLNRRPNVFFGGSVIASRGEESWSLLHIRLTLIKASIGIKVKVVGSKARAKPGFINEICISSKSRTQSRILTILALHVNINKVETLVKCQVRRAQGQG